MVSDFARLGRLNPVIIALCAYKLTVKSIGKGRLLRAIYLAAVVGLLASGG